MAAPSNAKSFSVLLIALFLLSLNRKSVFVGSSTIKVSDEDGFTLLLNALYFSHLGGLTSSSICSHESRKFVSGVRVRMSNIFNQSHLSINALQFLCSDEIETPVSSTGSVVMHTDEGDWTDIRTCPQGGFVTGLSMFMQMIRDQRVPNSERSRASGRYYDVYQIGRGSYISGITFNCSYEMDTSLGEYNEENFVDGKSAEEPGAKKSSVTIGVSSGVGVRLFCSGNRVMSGMIYEKEALITYTKGEQWIPVDLTIKCVILPNPVEHCQPELDWESLEKISCKNTTTPEYDSDPVNITCSVPYQNGLSPNKAIEGLNRILNAYRPLQLEGSLTRTGLMATLHGYYHSDWKQYFQINSTGYTKIVKRLHYKLTNGTYTKSLNDVSYEEPKYCSQIRNKSTEPLKYVIDIKQLVGYCSIYKIYFPYFKTQFQAYFERKIGGISTRIIFPMVDPRAKMIDLINTKLAALNINKLPIFNTLPIHMKN